MKKKAQESGRTSEREKTRLENVIHMLRRRRRKEADEEELFKNELFTM